MAIRQILTLNILDHYEVLVQLIYGYSLMVEQISPKDLVEVRFLVSVLKCIK